MISAKLLLGEQPYKRKLRIRVTATVFYLERAFRSFPEP